MRYIVVNIDIELKGRKSTFSKVIETKCKDLAFSALLEGARFWGYCNRYKSLDGRWKYVTNGLSGNLCRWTEINKEEYLILKKHIG